MLTNLFNSFNTKVKKFEQCSSNEKTFIFKYGNQVNKAQEILQLYKQFGDTSLFSQMWSIFSQLFNNFNKSLIKNYESHMFLENVSPWLMKLRNPQILIPGLKKSQKDVHIKHINSKVIIIKSKRKPR
jgi:FKBP12-rapamycin complex-associated protein